MLIITSKCSAFISQKNVLYIRRKTHHDTEYYIIFAIIIIIRIMKDSVFLQLIEYFTSNTFHTFTKVTGIMSPQDMKGVNIWGDCTAV